MEDYQEIIYLPTDPQSDPGSVEIPAEEPVPTVPDIRPLDPLPGEIIIVPSTPSENIIPAPEGLSDNEIEPVAGDLHEKYEEIYQVSVSPNVSLTLEPDYALSNNITVSVNTESVSLDELAAILSQNRSTVSVNVSNNSTSNNFIQVVSIDNTPWFEKPFDEYTTSEGIQFTILLCMVLGYLFHRLTKGVFNNGI